MAEYISKAELEKFKYLSVVTYEGGEKENRTAIALDCELFNELPTLDIGRMTRETFDEVCDNLEMMYENCDRKYDCGREGRACMDCGETVQQVVDLLERMVDE